MDPVTVAWQAAGAPRPVDATTLGVCSRCGQRELLVPTKKVISDNFTAFDQWLHLEGSGLCPACTWCFRSTILRTAPHLVSHSPPDARALTRPELAVILTRPLTPDHAVTVPLRPGRKHVLPAAVWGRVAVDTTMIAWGSHDAALLPLLQDLRSRGTTPQHLAAPAPPWRLLQTTPAAARPALLRDWKRLEPWRARRPWLDLAILATTPRSAAA